MNKLRTWSAVGLGLVGLSVGGCPGTVAVVRQGIRQLENTVVTVQTVSPLDIALPETLVTLNDTVVIQPDVIVISDIQTQLVPLNLSGDTVLGFVNDSGADVFIEFLADGVVQDVFVLDGDTLLLDFPCLTQVDLLSSIELDPVTGDVLVILDLSGETFLNPDDFICGDAVLMTFFPESISVGLDVIDLLQ